jgi:hypothetical protein
MSRRRPLLLLVAVLLLPATARAGEPRCKRPHGAEVSSSRWLTLILRTDGSAWTCGDWKSTFISTSGDPDWYPAPFTPPGSTRSISAGKYAAYVDDEFFGNNDYGEAGVDPEVQFSFDVPTNVPPVTGAAVAGYETSYFLSGGRVFAAGRNWHGELGNGTIDTEFASHFTFEPVKRRAWDGSLVDLAGVREVVSGTGTAFALMKDGTVWAWGYNAYGQLADGTTDDRPYAAPVRRARGRLLRDIVQVSSGIDRSGPDLGNSATHAHVLALARGGRVWAWGENRDGELANGNVWYPAGGEPFDPFTVSLPQTTPTLMRRPNGRPLAHITQVAAGGTHSLALADDGTIWTAGYNGSGQLGYGTALDARGSGWAAPTAWTRFHGRVRSIGAGPGTSFAVDSAGVLWSWGFKYNGGLCLGAPFLEGDNPGYDPRNAITRPTEVRLGDGGPPFSLGRAFACEDDEDDHRGRGDEGDDDED